MAIVERLFLGLFAQRMYGLCAGSFGSKAVCAGCMHRELTALSDPLEDADSTPGVKSLKVAGLVVSTSTSRGSNFAMIRNGVCIGCGGVV